MFHEATSGDKRLMIRQVASEQVAAKRNSLEQLMLVGRAGTRGEEREIVALEQLRGHVQLETSEAALEFVRLRTCAGTFNLFRSSGWQMVEVLPFSLHRTWRYGLPDSVFVLDDASFREGRRGVVTDRTWEAAGLNAAEVSREGSMFRIVRTVIISPCDTRSVDGQLTEITEAVQRNGGYAVIKKKLLKPIPIRWDLTSLEYRRRGEA